MINIPICACGKPYSLDAAVVLDVTLEEAHEKYNFCSLDCIEKRIAEMNTVNSEFGVTVRVVSKTFSDNVLSLKLALSEE